MEPKQLAQLIIQEMKEQKHISWIDPEIHNNQHEFIQLLIDERQEKIARRERIKEKIAGSLILSFIVTLITLIGVGALDWIKVHLK